MKKTIQNTINFLKKLILWFLKHFGLTFHTAAQKEITPQKKIEQTKHTIPIDTDTDANTTRDLKKEHFHNKEIFLPSKEDLERIMFNFIEKTFKLKIRNLPISLQKELQEYQTKTIQKLIPKITKQEITSKEKVEKALEENLKEDLQKKNLELNTLIKYSDLYTEQKQTNLKIETLAKEEKTNNLNIEKKNKKTSISLEQITPPILPKKQIQSIETQKDPKKSDWKSPLYNFTETKREVHQKEENKQEAIFYLEPEMPTETLLNETGLQTNTFIGDQEKIISPKLASPDTKKNIEEIEILLQKQEKKETFTNNELAKEEKTPEIFLNLTVIEQENNTLIEKAKQEYNKEELIQKNYEKMEKLLEEKIREIEKMLEKALNEIQKNKLKRELNKLKKTKEQLYLYKEKDLEELRISLEENIPLDDLLLVTEKLKQLTETEEIKQKEMLYRDIEKKTQREIQEMEKVLIKESYKRALRRLETPLFLSFPFIKNKHFRRFVSGLFLFRTFGFMKNLILGFPDTYEPVDLSYIQKGSDALVESITLTEQNIHSFHNLKQTTLLKYPELIDDELFMKDLNKLEIQLKKNYEKLLEQEKLVNKYFDKSKILIRKRKK